MKTCFNKKLNDPNIDAESFYCIFMAYESKRQTTGDWNALMIFYFFDYI